MVVVVVVVVVAVTVAVVVVGRKDGDKPREWSGGGGRIYTSSRGYRRSQGLLGIAHGLS